MDAVGVQSIASSLLSVLSRSCGCISISYNCNRGIREDGNDVCCDASSNNKKNDGWEKVTCLRDRWLKMGPNACHMCRWIGAEERERLSSSVGRSRW